MMTCPRIVATLKYVVQFSVNSTIYYAVFLSLDKNVKSLFTHMTTSYANLLEKKKIFT